MIFDHLDRFGSGQILVSEFVSWVNPQRIEIDIRKLRWAVSLI